MTSPQNATVRRVGEISRAYETAAIEYRVLAEDAGAAEADYRRKKAVFITRMLADGSSVAKAEYAADADEAVADACLAYKMASAVADAASKRLWQLSAQIEYGRTVLVTEREADRIHANGGAA